MRISYCSSDVCTSDLFSTVITDIAFALQDIEVVRTQLRRRRTHLRLPRPLSIADTRQQISEGIAHSHRPTSSYQLDLTMPGILPTAASPRLVMRLGVTLWYSPLGRPDNWQQFGRPNFAEVHGSSAKLRETW